MAGKLEGKTIAFLAAEGVEQVELTEPWKAVEDAGGTPELSRTEGGHVQAFNHLDKGDTFAVDHTVGRGGRRRGYDGLVLPGGVANPDFLRTDEDAVALRARVLRPGQAGRRDLPRPVDADRGGRRARPHAHLVAVAPDRPAQRGRDLGRRGGPRRPGPRHARASPTTCRRSAPSSSRRSPRACTRASARAWARPRDGPGRQRRGRAPRRHPRHRRHARRHELPPRGGVVPRVPARWT